MAFPFIYLASASPRRHELLDQMGVPHEILRVPPPEGEDEPRWPGEAAETYVRRTALDKAQHTVQWLQGDMSKTAHGKPAPILAADTAVILDGDVLGKPRDQADAAQMLARLSGTRHAVHTAVVLAWQGRTHERVSITEVQFKSLSPTEIADYCATGEPMGKAGSYAIQGRAGIFVAHLSGSYTGVMGLPVYETSELLAEGYP
ncbi:MAG: Maf-like protein [Alcaligenaceae bacterium]|nr:Maf-like protein [Alcaligenaceae bacterium]